MYARLPKSIINPVFLLSIEISEWLFVNSPIYTRFDITKPLIYTYKFVQDYCFATFKAR
jgi:hypothetical protein